MTLERRKTTGQPWETVEAPSGGSQTLVDLGVIAAADLMSGPIDIYTPAAGEFVQVILYPAEVVIGNAPAGIEVGVNVADGDENGMLVKDKIVAQLAINGPVSGSNFTYAFRNATVFDGSEVISALIEFPTEGFALYSAPGTWQANHAYPASVVLLIAAGHVWSQSAGGTSGGSAPDFAGNLGGTVTDNQVTWADEGVVPSTGSFHLYALTART